MAALQKFEILLDSPDHTFSPGEVIAGRIIVNLNRPKSIRGLTVRIKGKAQVSWSGTTGTGRDKKTVQFTGDEEYFRMEFNVLGQSGSGENVEIESGSHVFPFNFCLPRNIPSSFETSNGGIRYTIKAVMDRTWKFGHETSIAFTVKTPYELSQHTTAMSTIDDEDSATLCCLPCFNVDSMRVHIFLPSTGFAIGEAIQAKIIVDNTSESADVEKIELKLEQKIKLFARFPHSSTKKHTNIVQSVEQEGPFSKKDEIVVEMQVPSLPYSSMAFCSLIDVKYTLKIIIAVSGCYCNMEKEYPIVIGSKPIINIQPVENTMMVTESEPTAPYSPTEPPMPIETTMPPGSIPMPMGPTSPTDPMPMPMPMPMPSMPMPMPMPMPSMPMPEPSMPMPMPSMSMPDPSMPMPMPSMSMPYPPPQGQQLPGTTSGECTEPAPGCPYPPATSRPLGFVAPNAPYPTQAMPPSYDEAMGMNEKH